MFSSPAETTAGSAEALGLRLRIATQFGIGHGAVLHRLVGLAAGGGEERQKGKREQVAHPRSLLRVLHVIRWPGGRRRSGARPRLAQRAGPAQSLAPEVFISRTCWTTCSRL